MAATDLSRRGAGGLSLDVVRFYFMDARGGRRIQRAMGTKQQEVRLAMFDLANDDVIGHYYKGLDSISRSGSDCEPLTRHAGVGPKIAQWLVERGLIETGDSQRYPYAGRCYRVTELGRDVLKRGKRARIDSTSHRASP